MIITLVKMIQSIIHQEKDSLVQDIPWKGIPVVCEVLQPSSQKESAPLPQSGTWFHHAKNLLESCSPAWWDEKGPAE